MDVGLFFRLTSSCASVVQLRGCNLRWILCCEHAGEYLELQIRRGGRNKVAKMVDKVIGICEMFDSHFFHHAMPTMDERKNFSILRTLIDGGLWNQAPHIWALALYSRHSFL